MSDSIIQVKNLSKTFEIPHEKKDTLRSRFLNPFSRPRKSEFHALKDVNFDIKKGEIVGFIGKNGSGKSTLLKIITGIYAASEGSVKVQGSVVPFLELGIGFNAELTGRENVFLNGAILGMKTNYLRKKFDEIVDFAEVREFIDLPIKNYSSGMRVRLAFAIAVQAKADIYLLDEVLAVGDSQFQAKSINKMKELLLNGATVLFVSHSVNDIRDFCSRVILLNKGVAVYDGTVAAGIREYQLTMMSEEQKTKFLKLESEKRIDLEDVYNITTNLDDINSIIKQRSDYGDGRSELIDVELKNSKGVVTNELELDEQFTIRLKYKVKDTITNPHIGVSFCLPPALPMWIIRTPDIGNNIKSLKAGDILDIEFDAKNILLPDRYVVRLNLSDPVVNGTGKGTHTSIINEYFILTVTDPHLKPGEPPSYSGNINSQYSFEYHIN